MAWSSLLLGGRVQIQASHGGQRSSPNIHPQMNEWTKLAHPHHRMVLKKKETLMSAMTCMNLEDVTLSEIRCKKTNMV